MEASFRNVNAALIRCLRQQWPWLRWLLLTLILAAVVVTVLGALPRCSPGIRLIG